MNDWAAAEHIVRELSKFQNNILIAIRTLEEKIMAGVVEITNGQTTLHADLVAENGLVKQLLTAFANQTLTPAQAQTIVDGMSADDADAKSTITAIQAALNPPATEAPAAPPA